MPVSIIAFIEETNDNNDIKFEFGVTLLSFIRCLADDNFSSIKVGDPQNIKI